jgi:hypothetical protein
VHGTVGRDLLTVWYLAIAVTLPPVYALAAPVPLCAYRLWRVVAQGGSRADEWRARIEAAPPRGEQLRIALRAPLVNVEHLEHRLGHTPTTVEIVREFFARPAAAARDAIGRRARR